MEFIFGSTYITVIYEVLKEFIWLESIRDTIYIY